MNLVVMIAIAILSVWENLYYNLLVLVSIIYKKSCLFQIKIFKFTKNFESIKYLKK